MWSCKALALLRMLNIFHLHWYSLDYVRLINWFSFTALCDVSRYFPSRDTEAERCDISQDVVESNRETKISCLELDLSVKIICHSTNHKILWQRFPSDLSIFIEKTHANYLFKEYKCQVGWLLYWWMCNFICGSLLIWELILWWT